MRLITALALLPIVFGLGCAAPEGKTKQEKRDFIMKTHDDVLKLMYEKKKDLEAKVTAAPGYAVFSNTNITFIFVGGGGGYGVAVDGKTGDKTYMKMTEGNVGIGLGAKDMRMLLVFNDIVAFKKFRMGTWDFGGQADAAATSTAGEGSADAAGTVKKAVDIYQYTDAGVLLKATVGTAKFSKDKELN
jgi:lipid-binding SYLF domain-containing protein